MGILAEHQFRWNNLERSFKRDIACSAYYLGKEFLINEKILTYFMEYHFVQLIRMSKPAALQ